MRIEFSENLSYWLEKSLKPKNGAYTKSHMKCLFVRAAIITSKYINLTKFMHILNRFVFCKGMPITHPCIEVISKFTTSRSIYFSCPNSKYK